MLVLMLLTSVARAETAHVSINQRMFELGHLPLIKVNVVADSEDMTRLEFIVRQQGAAEKLMVQPINRYMVLLLGIDEVTDKQAELLVREYRINRWYELKRLPLFDTSVPVVLRSNRARVFAEQMPTEPPQTVMSIQALENKAIENKAIEARAVPATVVSSKVVPPPAVQAQRVKEVAGQPQSEPQSLGVPSASQAVAAPGRQVKALPIDSREPGCMLDFDGTETLWRVASRYAQNSHTHVYGAMLAIFDANPKAFSRGDIRNLRSDAKLHCPSSSLLESYGDKTAAKEKFEQM
ncbi:FimV/HubP family polar landmark protein [Shewanella algae]|uniref:FimV/HubP family polar landmark protein n=1 Tax=Shewanella algae TaxID=38313 RepID=UPI0015E7148D|nr:FimV/HubP family polar landmark protein [Shewanella algae]MBO2567850.1 fimbrial protein FimV [Shewanella algae]MBO2576451.1 fimbrial protein FimV [Shewanella algae]MBO2580762.1 fimbrial protein FimV [Shewanella algae]MBO2681995.1 fimbrial protein FimV [Shewanella algae]MDL2197160.1 FimV/HubP family polar landmark protein [Shewanella algae]